MADMCYYGNVMTTTRWWLCVTILHLQQYSHRLNWFLLELLNLLSCSSQGFNEDLGYDTMQTGA